MGASVSWSDLHDATLDRIDVDFGRGIAVIRLQLPKDTRVPLAGMQLSRLAAIGPVTIACEEFSLLVCPRQNPWGPSRYVNDARTSSGAGRSQVLIVEMQSGDKIEIQAARVTLSRDEQR